MMEYYILYDKLIRSIEESINSMAEKGWTLHTFGQNSSVFWAVMQREKS